MKKAWGKYKELWREMPGAMIVLHFTVTGGVVMAVLLVQNPVAGVIALIVWLLVLAAIVNPCLTIDLMRD